jgi:hypothetical protein
VATTFVIFRSRSGSRKSRSRSRSKSGSPTPRKKRLAILSDSEDDDGQPKSKKSRPKITDSDHEGEENEPKKVEGEVVVEKAPDTNKLIDSSGDEGVDDRAGGGGSVHNCEIFEKFYKLLIFQWTRISI